MSPYNMISIWAKKIWEMGILFDEKKDEQHEKTRS